MANDMDFIKDLIAQVLDPELLTKRFNAVKAEKNTWEVKWAEIQKNVFPNYRDYNHPSNTLQPKTHDISNHSGIVSGEINKIVSLLNSQTADPAVKWMNLTLADNLVGKSRDVEDWLSNCADSLYTVFADPESGFYSTVYSFLLDWYALGTACEEVVLKEDTGTIKFNCVSMQDIYAELSAFGDLDKIYRRFYINARQAIEKWGQNGNLHQSIWDCANAQEKGQDGRKFEFFEVCMKNPLLAQLPSLDYLSAVIDVTNKQVVTFNFHAFPPYVVGRFFVSPGETYGRSYVWNAMPDIKTINTLLKRILQSVDFMVFPMIAVRNLDSFPAQSVTPGMFIQGIDLNGHPTFQQMPFTGDIGILINFLQQKIENLRDALVARDLFPQESPAMTATEVNQRVIQMNNRLRPMIIILQQEFLNRIVKRTLKLLEQAGRLPQFPYERLGIDPEQLPDPIKMLRVSFSGQMEVMQKMQDIQNMDTIAQKAINLASVDQGVLDHINLGELIALQSSYLHLPPSLINPPEVVQQIQQERAKQQQEQQEFENQQTAMLNTMKMAQAMKNGGVNV